MNKYGNVFLLVLSLFLTLIVQTSIWPTFFITPQFIIPFLVFIVSYRELKEATLLFYLFAAISAIFTANSFGSLLSVYFIIFSTNIIFNDRFLQDNINYFSVSCFINTLLMNFLLLFFSPSSSHFFYWILSAGLTFVLSIPFYYYFLWLDEKTEKEAPLSRGAFL